MTLSKGFFRKFNIDKKKEKMFSGTVVNAFIQGTKLCQISKSEVLAAICNLRVLCHWLKFAKVDLEIVRDP